MYIDRVYGCNVDVNNAHKQRMNWMQRKEKKQQKKREKKKSVNNIAQIQNEEVA